MRLPLTLPLAFPRCPNSGGISPHAHEAMPRAHTHRDRRYPLTTSGRSKEPSRRTCSHSRRGTVLHARGVGADSHTHRHRRRRSSLRNTPFVLSQELFLLSCLGNDRFPQERKFHKKAGSVPAGHTVLSSVSSNISQTGRYAAVYSHPAGQCVAATDPRAD